MDRSAVLKVLKDAEPLLRSRGVMRAAVFGSVARGDAGPDSDIDIMVELTDAPGARLDLWGYIGVVQTIQGMFTGPVDVVSREGLKPHVRPTAERQAIYAF